jgi:hypothetical protein
MTCRSLDRNSTRTFDSSPRYETRVIAGIYELEKSEFPRVAFNQFEATKESCPARQILPIDARSDYRADAKAYFARLEVGLLIAGAE